MACVPKVISLDSPIDVKNPIRLCDDGQPQTTTDTTTSTTTTMTKAVTTPTTKVITTTTTTTHSPSSTKSHASTSSKTVLPTTTTTTASETASTTTSSDFTSVIDTGTPLPTTPFSSSLGKTESTHTTTIQASQDVQAGSSLALVAGAGGGAVIVLALIIVLVFFVLARRRSRKGHRTHNHFICPEGLTKVSEVYFDPGQLVVYNVSDKDNNAYDFVVMFGVTPKNIPGFQFASFAERIYQQPFPILDYAPLSERETVKTIMLLSPRFPDRWFRLSDLPIQEHQYQPSDKAIMSYKFLKALSEFEDVYLHRHLIPQNVIVDADTLDVYIVNPWYMQFEAGSTDQVKKHFEPLTPYETLYRGDSWVPPAIFTDTPYTIFDERWSAGLIVCWIWGAPATPFAPSPQMTIRDKISGHVIPRVHASVTEPWRSRIQALVDELCSSSSDSLATIAERTLSEQRDTGHLVNLLYDANRGTDEPEYEIANPLPQVDEYLTVKADTESSDVSDTAETDVIYDFADLRGEDNHEQSDDDSVVV